MSKEDERFRNMLLYNIWATDQEVDEMMPSIAIWAVGVALILFILCCIGDDPTPKDTNQQNMPVTTSTTSTIVNQDKPILEKEDR